MTDHETEDSTDGEDRSPLAELSEKITRRLQDGEPVEAEDYLDQYPSCAGPIRGLLPTLRDLADLGRSISRERRSRRHGGAEDRP
jgi:hypothetical protein